MSGPTETQVVPSPQLLLGLTQLMAASGPFHLLDLGLYQNNATLSRATVIGDLTPADFHGYAAVTAVTFSSPFLDADGTALALGADHAFVATSGGTLNPQTIYGYYVGPAGLADFAAAYAFDTPVPIVVVGNAVVVVPFLRYSGN